jgi:uncharacterized membrane protein SirB2
MDGSNYRGKVTIFIIIIVIKFGILQIRLFFKLFNMADDVARILKIMEHNQNEKQGEIGND